MRQAQEWGPEVLWDLLIMVIRYYNFLLEFVVKNHFNYFDYLNNYSTIFHAASVKPNAPFASSDTFSRRCQFCCQSSSSFLNFRGFCGKCSSKNSKLSDCLPHQISYPVAMSTWSSWHPGTAEFAASRGASDCRMTSWAHHSFEAAIFGGCCASRTTCARATRFGTEIM